MMPDNSRIIELYISVFRITTKSEICLFMRVTDYLHRIKKYEEKMYIDAV